jgi:serine protease Do
VSGLLTAFVMAALSLPVGSVEERRTPRLHPVSLQQEHSTAASIIASKPSVVSIEVIARQVTVRILNGETAGSGVIISQQNDIFTVLTCDHVVDKEEKKYKIFTSDGITYPAIVRRFPKLGSIDLAIVQFRSTRPYKAINISKNRSLSEGRVVYAAGYPNYNFPNTSSTESTYDWGTRAYVLTTGKVEMLSKKPLSGGYSLGYTNKIAGGMSGGPILNQQGQLIGINGRLQYPLQGIKAYVFADGTIPSQSLFEKMEALSWGIPVNNFQQLLGLLE